MPRRVASAVAASVIASFLFLAPLAPAARAADAPDEVTLRDGTVLHGTVLSQRRGVSVKILEAGHKRPRTISWGKVSEVARGKFTSKAAVAPESAPAPEAPPAPAAPPPPANAVHLHIDSPAPALLYSHDEASGTFDGHSYVLDRATPVCAAPCDQEVEAPPDRLFTTSGAFGTSAPFTLTGRRGDVELSLHPGNPTVRTTGLVLTIGGGIVTVLGGTLAVIGAVLGGSNITVNGKPTDGATFSGDSWLVPTGLGISGAGVAMVVGGVVALVTNKTSYDLHPAGNGGKGEARARYWMGEF